LSKRERSEGWCDSCGKKLPASAGQAPARANLQAVVAGRANGPYAALALSPAPSGVKKFRLGSLIGGLFLLLFSVFFFYMAASGQAERDTSTTTSRRVRAMENLLGKTGTAYLCGAVFA